MAAPTTLAGYLRELLEVSLNDFNSLRALFQSASIFSSVVDVDRFCMRHQSPSLTQLLQFGISASINKDAAPTAGYSHLEVW